jgi:RecB family exonuclease
VPKTPVLVDFLKKMTFSATSVNTYVHNPYEFYFKYVLGLKEKDDLLDDPESKHVGIFVHALLEEAFRRFKGKKPVLDASFGRYFRGLFETRFEQTFGGAMVSDAFLMKEVLSARLQRFLQQEARRCERVDQVLYLEHVFEDVIDFPCGPVKFVYRVDRVDRAADGTIMIIDYKTGAMDRMPVSSSITSFQMPLYVHYLDRLYPDASVNAAIYHLRTSKLEMFLDDAGPVGRKIVLPEFMTALGAVMAQIFDPAVPFMDKR